MIQQQVPMISNIEKRSTSLKDEANAYFVQGFDLPKEQQVIRNRLLAHMPHLKTSNYRQSLLTIVGSLSELDRFSNNIQGKVDCLLQAQETQFVQSYKHHIKNINTEFDKMKKHIDELQEKIRYYQNEGKMSALVKKVFLLEGQSAKLYKILHEKDKKLKDFQLTLKVREQEMRRLEETVKSAARQKSQVLWRERIHAQQHIDSSQTLSKNIGINVFTTEVQKKSSFSHNQQNQSFLEDKKAINSKNIIDYNLSLKSVTQEIQKNIKHKLSASKSKQISLAEQSLHKQNKILKARNKKLTSFQTKLVDNQQQMEGFFIQCVQQLKKQIRIRKKIDYCTLEQFKKEDKLLLMIKILSNEEILAYLHQRIFRNHTKLPTKSFSQLTKADITDEGHHKKFPKLKFNLNYQQK